MILTDSVNFCQLLTKSSYIIDLNIQMYFKLRNKYFEMQ